MEVDNTIYETFGHNWWADDAGFEITSLRYCLNPLRHGYFKRVLDIKGIHSGTLLDIGCGGGFLSEEFAKDGFRVCGVDPSPKSINAAKEHATINNLDIEYFVACGESLPFSDSSFDIVACCDVLEHVNDPSMVIREVSRVLKKGGIFLFDTVNRTLRSKIVLIKVCQDWILRIPNAHVWKKFIKPRELVELLRANNIEVREMKGIGPRRNLIVLLRGLLNIYTGRLRGRKVAEIFGMREVDDLGMSYMGWAVKQNK